MLPTWNYTYRYYNIYLYIVISHDVAITCYLHNLFLSQAASYINMFPPNHYGVTMLSFALVIAMTLLYAVINFPLLNAVEKMADVLHIPPPPYCDPPSHSVDNALCFAADWLLYYIDVGNMSLITLFVVLQ